MKFLTDKMFGSLTRWLRILGYDTIYANDLEDDSDDSLISFASDRGRILITRDKELYERFRRKVNCCYVKSHDVISQLSEVKAEYDIKIELKMERCSLCNATLRQIESEDELIGKEYVPSFPIKNFWICTNCGRVYWRGSHWKDMREKLTYVQARRDSNPRSAA